MRPSLLPIALSLTLAGCGPRDLSRPQAQRLLNSYPQFATLPVLFATADGVEALKRDRMVDVDTEVLTSRGKQHFISFLYFPRKVSVLQPINPCHPRVTEITGISEGALPATKDVDFRWTLDGMDPRIAPYVARPNLGGLGRATFKRFDDGWRVIDVRK